MNDYTTAQSVLFPGLFAKPLLAQFDEPQSSSDAGAVLLKAADRRLGLIDRLAGALVDRREAGKVRHELRELLAQRIFGIACGYPDCNDAARLGGDPIQKLLVGRDPIEGNRLSSQSTLSRFENAFGGRQLYRLGAALAEAVIEHHRVRLRGRARRVTIDLDTTDLETYGEQQLTFFSGFYGEWCYQPMVGWLTFNDEAEQYAFAAVLRAGNAPAAQGAMGILRRTITAVRAAFRKARIRVRLDAAFAGPEIFDLFETEGVEYLVGMAENKVLKRRAEKLMREVRKRSKESGKTETVYGDCRYAAQTWPHSRRVIFKAEVVQHPGREPRDNARFVVTNLKHSPEEIYTLDYCGRGEVENRIKELKELRIDRTSCTAFWANQFRVLLSLAAYALMQELRRRAARTSLARAQVATLRERLIKIAGRLVGSVRRLVLHLPANCAFTEEWVRVGVALGATPG